MAQVAYKGVVHPWLCDVMGHLTTRHYMAMFDDSSYQFLFDVFGWTGSDSKNKDRGWVDVSHTIDYLEEVKEGTLVEIKASIIRIGNKSITCQYEMLDRIKIEHVVARMEAVIVYFNTKTRSAIPLEEEMKYKASKYLISGQTDQ